jgi:hypothetical protein
MIMAKNIIKKTDKKHGCLRPVFVRFGDKLSGEGMKRFCWGSHVNIFNIVNFCKGAISILLGLYS